MLHDRILKILDVFGLTKSQCAKELGVTHKTFAGYLKPEGEHNLWQHLPRFLEWYPRLSRQWLYFDEGPMQIGYGVPLDQPVPLRMIAEAVDAMAKDAGGTMADLLRYVAGLPQDKVVSGDAETRIRDLEQKLAESQAELLGATKRIIALQDEIMTMRQGQPEGIVFSSGAGPSPAPTTPGAARLSRPDNDPIK